MADIWDTPPRAELDEIVAPSGVAVRSMPRPATAVTQATAQNNVVAAQQRAACRPGIYRRDDRDRIVVMVKIP
jgi:hypothetical protein